MVASMIRINKRDKSCTLDVVHEELIVQIIHNIFMFYTLKFGHFF